MKRLRKLALNLNRIDWPNDYGYAFYLRSRSLCNYLERALSRIDVHAVDSTKLCITGHSGNNTSYEVNSSNIACLHVPFSTSEYERCQSAAQINEFMIQFLKSGLASLPPENSGPIAPILELAQQFLEGGFRNEWMHKSRVFRAQKLRASLCCALTTSNFELDLETTNRDGIVMRRRLLRTDPDETAFHYRFHDIVMEKEHLVISSKQTEPLCRIPLAEFDNSNDFRRIQECGS